LNEAFEYFQLKNCVRVDVISVKFEKRPVTCMLDSESCHSSKMTCV